jgi:hypothetical protein
MSEDIYYNLREHASDIKPLLRKLMSITTDGGTTMLGRSYGLVALCKRGESIPVFIAYHYITH